MAHADQKADDVPPRWMRRLGGVLRSLRPSFLRPSFPDDLARIRRRYPFSGEHRIAAVGDIHGRADCLAHLFGRLDALHDAPDEPPLYEVYLGDYVDRGPESRAVLDLLMDRAQRRALVALKGNHEQMLLAALERDDALSVWLKHGGHATLASFGLRAGRVVAQPRHLRAALATALGPDRLAFLTQLPPYHLDGEFLFVHAGVRPGVALADQSEADLLWIRHPFLSAIRPFGGTVVHGHTPSRRPVFREHRISIDTGAFHTSVLTCLLVSAKGIDLLDTAAA